MEDKSITYVGSLDAQYTPKQAQLQAAPFAVKMKKLGAFGGVTALITAVLITGAFKEDIRWLLWVAVGVAVIGTIGSLFISLTAKLVNCPYCEKQLGQKAFDSISAHDDNEMIECSHCRELLHSNQGVVRAFTPEDGKDKKSYDAPIFVQAVWPRECIICGAAATHHEPAKKTSVNVGKLLMGRLSVAYGSVNGIPYCQAHRGTVTLSLKEDIPMLVFPDLDSRKRYILVNRMAGRIMHVMKFQ
jgi:hypothetical protein